MLDKQRAEIVPSTAEIVSLFERRMQVVMDVARIKRKMRWPFSMQVVKKK